ncbi:MAG TPA: ankyrin repeat domain-containing protein [Candidatus Dormibacteraeota bacterium]
MIDAVEKNDLAAADALIRRGANVNERGPLSLTPLMIAAGHGSTQMVDKLLMAGADVHAIDSSMGASPLHFGAQGGVVDVARLLLDAGAFINLQSATVGLTPLINAIWAKRVPMVRYLLQRGAAIDVRTHLDGATAWDFVGTGVVWTAGFTVPESEMWGRQIRELLEQQRERNGGAVAAQELMRAVRSGDLAAVRTAIAAGADVNEKSPVLATGGDGQTPLLVACFLGHTEIVRALLAAGANPRINDYLLKATPVHKAAYAGRAGALLALREQGHGEVNAQGPYNGYTAMHDAVWHGHREALEVILDWPGVRHDLRGLDGRTAEELAGDLGYSELAAMIKVKAGTARQAHQPAAKR